jgi:hypothetical protein
VSISLSYRQNSKLIGRRQQFDEDVRDLVKVNIVHGFWKNTRPEKKDLEVS